jgi:hypothetical protein
MKREAVRFVIGIGLKVLTDKFLARFAVEALYRLAKKTDNTLDDRLVSVVANSLSRRSK